MKVLFLTNLPSPYRVDFFNELGKQCDLTVVFEKKFSAEREKTWQKFSFEHFQGYFLKGISTGVDSAFSFGVLKFLKNQSYDFIICANFSTLTGLLAVHYMKRHKIPYWLETDGGSPKGGNGFKEKLKRWVVSGAAGYFSTSRENDNYFLAYGAKKECIFRYPFTSLFQKDLLCVVPNGAEKQDLRKELKMKESFIVLSVGRFTYLNGYGKGYDVLLKAAKSLPKEIGWYIIGGKPTAEFATMKREGELDNVHFVDFKQKEELKKYYRAADLFALMTVGEAWGLVINEAMACGLPVITTERCIAGTELVHNGETGYLLSVGDNNGLATSVYQMLQDQISLQKMGLNALKTIAGYTFESMAKTHIEVFKKIGEKQA